MILFIISLMSVLVMMCVASICRCVECVFRKTQQYSLVDHPSYQAVVRFSECPSYPHLRTRYYIHERP